MHRPTQHRRARVVLGSLFLSALITVPHVHAANAAVGDPIVGVAPVDLDLDDLAYVAEIANPQPTLSMELVTVDGVDALIQTTDSRAVAAASSATEAVETVRRVRGQRVIFRPSVDGVPGAVTTARWVLGLRRTVEVTVPLGGTKADAVVDRLVARSLSKAKAAGIQRVASWTQSNQGSVLTFGAKKRLSRADTTSPPTGQFDNRFLFARRSTMPSELVERVRRVRGRSGPNEFRSGDFVVTSSDAGPTTVRPLRRSELRVLRRHVDAKHAKLISPFRWTVPVDGLEVGASDVELCIRSKTDVACDGMSPAASRLVDGHWVYVTIVFDVSVRAARRTIHGHPIHSGQPLALFVMPDDTSTVTVRYNNGQKTVTETIARPTY